MVNFNQVEIKRTIPKGAGQGNDFKTKKIFVGGIPPTFTEGLLQFFFFCWMFTNAIFFVAQLMNCSLLTQIVHLNIR